MPDVSFVDVAGRKTQVIRGGSGPPFVYLHSALGETDWMPWHDELTTDFEVIVPAHPGFADSEGLEDIDSMDDLAFHYDDLFAELGIERPVLSGLSLGGWIAAEFTVRWPEKVERLVLIDAAGLRVEGSPMPDMWRHRPPELADMVFHRKDHPLYLLMQQFDPEHPPPAEVLIPFFKAQQATARVAWNPYLHDPKLPGRLHRITCPTLVVWGEKDGLIPVEHGRRYAELIPGARLETITDCAHLVPLECPDDLLAALRGFLGDS